MTEQPNETSAARRIDPMRHVPALDGLRGVAALMVLVFHTTYLKDLNGPLSSVAWRVSRGLVTGVDVFFVLSGFLISNILIRAKGSPTYYRDFYIRRVLRIFPLYYAVVLVCLLAPLLFPILQRYDLSPLPYGGLNYWLYLSNVWMPERHPVLAVSWSLAIEEQFYLVWPFVVMTLRHRQLVGLCSVLILVGIVTRYLAVVPGIGPELSPLARVDLLAMGALGALWDTSGRATRRARRAVALGLSLAGVVVLGIVWRVAYGPWGPGMAVYGRTAVGCLALSCIIAFAFSAPAFETPARMLETRMLCSFGKYSYAIYLFHSGLDAIVRRAIDVDVFIFEVMGSELPMQVAYWGLIAVLSWAAAWVSWHLFERHFLRLKERFAPRHKRPSLPRSST